MTTDAAVTPLDRLAIHLQNYGLPPVGTDGVAVYGRGDGKPLVEGGVLAHVDLDQHQRPLFLLIDYDNDPQHWRRVRIQWSDVLLVDYPVSRPRSLPPG